MAWCKRDVTFSGKIFFSFKSARVFACAFQFSRKTFSCIFFLTEMLSVFGFVAFIVHASIFCLRFSQKQSANQPKKIQGNGLLLNIKAHAKIQALLKEKKFYPKKSLTSFLHKAIQFLGMHTL